MRGFTLHARAINFLMPPTKSQRRREEKRAKQLQAISNTLFSNEADDDNSTTIATLLESDVLSGGVRFRPPPVTADAAIAASKDDLSHARDPSIWSWMSSMVLVPETCSLHPMRLSQWRALQYMPSLVYRLQVCSSYK